MQTHPYISRLQASNLGLFKSLDFHFMPGINIIIGANASGKTSLLRAITYCFNSNALSKSIYKHDTSFGITINAGNEEIYKAGFASMSKDNDTYHSDTIVQGSLFQQKSFSPYPGNVPYNVLAIGAHRFFDYSKVDAIIKEPMKEAAKKKYDRENTEYIDKPSMPSIKQWIINRYFHIDKDWAKIETENWKKVVNGLSRVAPDGISFSLKEIRRDLEPKFEVDGNICYLEELSSGFKSVLSIVFSIVQWIEEVNDEDHRLIQKAEGTVLIDEIDMHLHPSWQASIIKTLHELFPKIQFIVTTHSPMVLTGQKKTENNLVQKIMHDKDGNFWGEAVNGYGEEVSNIIKLLMDTEPRDKIASINIEKLFSLIDSEKYREADIFLNQMKEEYGELPVFHKADAMLTFLEADSE